MMAEMIQSFSLDRELIRHKLGLDVPVYVQYGRWIGGVLQGDLGPCFTDDRGDTDLGQMIDNQHMRTYVIRRLLLVVPTLFPVTIIVFAVELGVFAVIIGLLISLPIGIYSGESRLLLRRY